VTRVSVVEGGGALVGHTFERVSIAIPKLYRNKSRKQWHSDSLPLVEVVDWRLKDSNQSLRLGWHRLGIG
jgi:hypothetical protein